MDWSDLLQPWGLVALVLVGLAVVVALIVALRRAKFRVTKAEISLPPVGKVTVERVEEKETPGKAAAPRRARTIQKARASGGADATVEQSAPGGTPSTQDASADGPDTKLDLKQKIH